MQNIFSEIRNIRLSLYLKVEYEEVSPEFQLFGFFNGSWSIVKGLAVICAFFLLQSVSVRVFLSQIPNPVFLRLH